MKCDPKRGGGDAEEVRWEKEIDFFSFKSALGFAFSK